MGKQPERAEKEQLTGKKRKRWTESRGTVAGIERRKEEKDCQKNWGKRLILTIRTSDTN